MLTVCSPGVQRLIESYVAGSPCVHVLICRLCFRLPLPFGISPCFSVKGRHLQRGELPLARATRRGFCAHSGAAPCRSCLLRFQAIWACLQIREAPNLQSKSPFHPFSLGWSLLCLVYKPSRFDPEGVTWTWLARASGEAADPQERGRMKGQRPTLAPMVDLS